MRLRLVRSVSIIALAAVVLFTARAEAQESGRWDLLLDLPNGDVQHLIFATDDTAWAAAAGAIFRSPDAGRTWEIASLTRSFMSDLEAAPGGQHGWAVGTLGQLYLTEDGGATWVESDPGTEVNISHVEALSEDVVLIAGTGIGLSDVPVFPETSSFRRSTDGGFTWSDVALDGYRVVSLTALPDGAHAWVAAEKCIEDDEGGFGCRAREPALLASDDGGLSWTPVHEGRSFRSVDFFTTDDGWSFDHVCAGESNTFECKAVVSRTDDGGRTWSETFALSQWSSFNVFPLGARSAVIAVTDCVESCSFRLLRTGDGGETWETVEEGTDTFVNALAFNSRGEGIRTGTGGVLWSDDGSTWSPSTLPITMGSGNFDFVNERTGWLVASNLLRTDDGGESFKPVGGPPPDLIDFVSETEGWGTDLVCDPACGNTLHIMHTGDGGRSWQIQRTLALGNYVGLDMHAADDGWAYSLSDRLLLRTIDGRTWEDRALPGPVEAINNPSVGFAPGGVGWFIQASCAPAFVECATALWRTTDGAGSWHRVGDVPLSDGCPVSIIALDARHAWIGGSDCIGLPEPILFRTTDGGVTWERLPDLGEGSLSALTFFDPMIGRALRITYSPETSEQTATLLRTADGGSTWTEERVPESVELGGRAEFVTPELAFADFLRVPGFTSATNQLLYRYSGIAQPPPIVHPPVTPPDTGAGRGGANAPIPALALAGVLAGAAFAAFTVGWPRRRV